MWVCVYTLLATSKDFCFKNETFVGMIFFPLKAKGICLIIRWTSQFGLTFALLIPDKHILWFAIKTTSLQETIGVISILNTRNVFPIYSWLIF